MKHHCTSLLAATLCIALAGMAPAAAQAPPATVDGHATGLPPSLAGLDLARTVAAAVDWHPSVRSAVDHLYASRDYVDAARAGYFPQLRAGITTERGNHNLPGYNSRQAHRFAVSVSQMLYDFGKVGSAVDRARAQQSVAQARVLLAVDDVAREAAHAWIEVARYEELQAIAGEQALGVTAIADLVRERRSLGASPRSDEMQAQAREEAARAFELETAAQLERWRSQLRHLTGLAALPATHAELPAAMAQACLLRTNPRPVPSVLIAEAEGRVALAELDQARAHTRPTLSLDGSVARGLDADSRMGQSHDSSVMLNISAPLYEGGGNQARRRAASHALAAADAALQTAKLANSQLLEDARAQAAGHARRAGVLDDRAGSLAETRTLYRQQYLDLGTRSLLDLLNAEQEYQQARIERANNRHSQARMQVDCLHGMGRTREAFGLEGRELAGVGLAP